MTDTYRNLAIGTVLVAPVSATAGNSLTLYPNEGLAFSANMPCTLFPSATQPTPANAEVGYITDVTGDVLTILRAQEGSTAKTVEAGWILYAGPSAKTFNDINSNAIAYAVAL